MNEETLFHGYRNMEAVEKTAAEKNEIDDALAAEIAGRRGYVKCIVEGCITMIAPDSAKVMCNWHRRNGRL